MKAGVIGRISGEFEKLESSVTSVTERGFELQRCIDVEETELLPDGTTLYHGEAAKDSLVSIDSPKITEDGIQRTSDLEVETTVTEFLAVPGDFVAVSSSSGIFAFDLIGQQVGCHIERAKIDLDYFLQEHEEGNIWQLGFYETGGQAEKGVVYGNQVLEDAEIGGILDLSHKNQLGVDYAYGDDSLRMTMAKSGYVEVYQPSDYDAVKFGTYLTEEIVPYLQTEDN